MLGLGAGWHQRNDAVLRELARVYVRDALKRWVPGAKVLGVEAEQQGAELVLRVRVQEGVIVTGTSVAVSR